ncbi:hypothetical protein AcV5_003716 [Taiwanofungus camphoratus]|nr:hypothetical protein AcV5_003716 [Antrodia cinnamomea]
MSVGPTTTKSLRQHRHMILVDPRHYRLMFPPNRGAAALAHAKCSISRCVACDGFLFRRPTGALWRAHRPAEHARRSSYIVAHAVVASSGAGSSAGRLRLFLADAEVHSREAPPRLAIRAIFNSLADVESEGCFEAAVAALERGQPPALELALPIPWCVLPAAACLPGRA